MLQKEKMIKEVRGFSVPVASKAEWSHRLYFLRRWICEQRLPGGVGGGVISIYMVFEVINLDEVTKELNINT